MMMSTDALQHLRTDIKSYYPDSAELLLSGALAGQPRFNFYFEIAPGQRFLLYLNWDGDGYGFTLKCLEFPDVETLQKLIDAYPANGSKVFNMGQPRSAVSFSYMPKSTLRPFSSRGVLNSELPSEVSSGELLTCIDPLSQGV